jgi:hypothetical protein
VAGGFNDADAITNPAIMNSGDAWRLRRRAHQTFTKTGWLRSHDRKTRWGSSIAW